MLYDTHCHLNYHTDEELKDVISRAKLAGLGYIMNAGAKISDVRRAVDICSKFSDNEIKIFCGVANHPENSKENVVSSGEIINLARMSDNIKAIGETGLDTHIAENFDFIDDQILSFEHHIEASLNLKLPLIVHTRGDFAVSKSIEMLEFYQKDGIRAVMHSYTDSVDNAKKLLDLGCFVSFSGIVTFKNADNVRDVAHVVPIERMFVETDAPFLAPTPMRGKTNETSFVKYTASYLSEFLKIDYKEFCEITTQNAKNFFNHN